MADKKLSEGFMEVVKQYMELLEETQRMTMLDDDVTIDLDVGKMQAKMKAISERSLVLMTELIEMLEATNYRLNIALDRYLGA